MLPAIGDKSLRWSTLQQLLEAEVAVEQGDPGLDRRLTVASHLYAAWTEKGTCPAALAERFVMEFMARNKPVIIQGLTEDWRACKEWVRPDGSPDLAFMQRNFGDAVIWATDTSSQDAGYGGGARQRMTLRDYVTWWKRYKAGKVQGLLYLKDWHFADEFPQYHAYRLPVYFHSDWLNDYFDHRRLFVYLGPKGSFTPLHADVLRSYSWSTNVCGRKRWQMLPPRHTHLLFDSFKRQMAPSFNVPDDSSTGRFPNLARARELMIECIQEPGETIFVPSGWHHCVENLEDTLSINHNWLNAHNVHWALALLQGERTDAVAAIEDCRSACSPSEFESLNA
ncbi:hypothetical protein WJX73_002391 [Symbiochloris irregularis]|uniref:JmjC domain-containing protein n=1 Tax=Symbiochloris irregularis TaxID=706552 RepID=A0AAW1P351_9CHLO